jgi:hypothetical protein
MESALTIDAKNSIKVYEFNMKREWIKIGNRKNVK